MSKVLSILAIALVPLAVLFALLAAGCTCPCNWSKFSAKPGRDVWVATGYSDNADPLAGAREAVQMALDNLRVARQATPVIKGAVFYENYKQHPSERDIGRAVSAMVARVETMWRQSLREANAEDAELQRMRRV